MQRTRVLKVAACLGVAACGNSSNSTVLGGIESGVDGTTAEAAREAGSGSPGSSVGGGLDGSAAH